MTRRFLLSAALASAVATASCAASPNLTEALTVTDVLSGWYDNGMKDGMNHMVPTITFRLRNESDRPLNSVQLTVAFWMEGKDGELDSLQVTGIGSTAVPPGQSTDSITVRSTFGYTLQQPRAELFTHGDFKDWTVKMFARRSGRIYAIGEFKVDRRFIPHASKDSGQP
jgi:hypothetical protein